MQNAFCLTSETAFKTVFCFKKIPCDLGNIYYVLLKINK